MYFNFHEGYMTNDELQEVKNLLAVIHRDDGEYTANVGLVQSCKNAIEKVNKLRVDLDKCLYMNVNPKLLPNDYDDDEDD